MADVFISCKKSDKDRVRPLVEHLRAAGLDVWWDEGIQPSMSWRGEIARQLQAAKCVVAVWTHDSVDHESGQWVMEEATHGLRRRILAPVRLDLVEPPLGFGEVQYADLAAWDGAAADPRFAHFLAVVKAIAAAEPMPAAPAPTQFAAPGIKLQNVRMENVRIQVGAQADAEDDTPPERVRLVADPPKFSLSVLVTRAIGVILPLIGVTIFVFTMGNMACDQGNAPAFFCRALDAVTERPAR
ncbi:MAG: toll/interleukin-1 receptor domain-containing protein [Hyphomonadaceae bacterium]|nr:toll/interleukin-1 receptor domain-containing protein [Hyphomonadaceae bacterium]